MATYKLVHIGVNCAGEPVQPGDILDDNFGGQSSARFERIHTYPHHGTPMLSIRDVRTGRKRTVAAASFAVQFIEDESFSGTGDVPAIDRTGWEVVSASGPEAERCIDDAIIHARLTGSIGATYSVEGDNTPESSAQVRREPSELAREVEFHVSERVTPAEARDVLAWCREWARDTFEDYRAAEDGGYLSEAYTDAHVLRVCDSKIDGGLSFVLADVRRTGYRHPDADAGSMTELADKLTPKTIQDWTYADILHELQRAIIIDADACLDVEPAARYVLDRRYAYPADVCDAAYNVVKTCNAYRGAQTRPAELDDETATLLGIDARADDEKVGALLAGDHLSEDWLLANLPEGWSYDCTFSPVPAFVIYAPGDPNSADRPSFLLPLKFLK